MEFRFSLKQEIQEYMTNHLIGEKNENTETIEFNPRGPQAESNNKKFRMLIDCECCMHRLYGGFYPDFQSGGQWKPLQLFYKELNNACNNSQMEIFFFFNGTQPNEDGIQHDWIVDQRHKAQQIRSLYDNFCPTRPAKSNYFVEMAFLAEFIKQQANVNNNFTAFQSHTDHSMEILDVCRQFKCDALLTNNMDIITLFLVNKNLPDGDSEKIVNASIYDPKSLYLSRSPPKQIKAVKLNFDKILSYNNFKSVEEFAWFMTLLGNRFISANNLESFYMRHMEVDKKKLNMRDTLREYIDLVRRYVNKLRKPIQDSIYDVIGYDRINEGQFKGKQLNRSLDYYLNNPIKTEEIYSMNKTKLFKADARPQEATDEANLINRLRTMIANCVKPSIIYKILTQQKVFIPCTTLEPMNEHNTLRADEIFRPIRYSIYSIIISGLNLANLQRCNNNSIGFKDHLTIEEIIYDLASNSIKTIPLIVYPLYAKITMEEIWKLDSHKKMKYFLKIIYNEDMIGTFNFLPYVRNETFHDNEFFIPCCALRYMIRKHKLLCKSDIEAFLITFVFLSISKCGQQFNGCEIRNARSTHLANLFISAMEHISYANQVCGNPMTQSAFQIQNYFNGIFFQRSYSNCLSNNKEFYKILLNSYVKGKETLEELNISMTVDNLKKFIYHNLENDVSSSAENSERSNMAQYETQKLFQDKRVVPIENKVQCENFSGTESSNLNKNKFDTCGIFTKDLMQQRFLKMKISQQNNPPLGGGRGILAFHGKQHRFSIDTVENLNKSDRYNDDQYYEKNKLKVDKNRRPQILKNRSSSVCNSKVKDQATSDDSDIDSSNIVLDTYVDTWTVQPDLSHQKTSRIRCDYADRYI